MDVDAYMYYLHAQGNLTADIRGGLLWASTDEYDVFVSHLGWASIQRRFHGQIYSQRLAGNNTKEYGTFSNMEQRIQNILVPNAKYAFSERNRYEDRVVKDLPE